MPNKFQCEIVPLTVISDLCRKLAVKIQDSGYKIDLVVAIARGGFVPARLLCDYLHIHQLTSLKVEHYTGTEKGKEALLKYPLNADISGKNILLVDDVNDTGKSIQTALEHLRSKNPASVKIAVMHEKKGSLLESDFFIEYLESWRWLIYEWAVIEDVGGFLEKSDCKNTGQCLAMLKDDYGIEWDEKDLENIRPFVNLNF